MSNSKSPGVLFVCLGNICRSPVAEGSFIHLVKERNLEDHFNIDSAGTAAYHVGEPANVNSRKVAARHNITLPSSARQFKVRDFDAFDYIFAMDSSNFHEILNLARNDADRNRVYMYRSFDPEVDETRRTLDLANRNRAPDVPDPYYGGLDDFQNVQDMAIRTGDELLDWLLEQE